MFKLEIKTGNAAFEDDMKYEITRILLEVSQKVTAGYDSGSCMDRNGNKVGEWRLNT